MHVPGQYYHIYNRGIGRQPIFTTEENYRFLVRRAEAYLADSDVTVVAYCLMPNHYHFLMRPQQDDALSRFIQRLFNSYSQAFNRQEGRRGTLFEGRAKSILVEREEHVLHLCRYIHLNPVKAQLVENPADWLFSSYLDWIGQRAGTLVDREFVQAYFPSTADYELFVESGIDSSVEREMCAYWPD